ncbi:hypothetical protein [Duncaniella muris]|jgi:hypothetical protein|uniref:hypothetical protein n=1 Tax=Duncaniella muris TaxID=2094150 RepID=UPI00272D812F|nr:hypothetical protein [Duncaniella muris]
MTIELIAISVSCLIMTLYLTAYINTVGIPASISATYYNTEKKWLFPSTIATTGLCALMPLLNNTPESYQFVAFFIVAATLFVASAPAFRDDMIGKVHGVSAAVLGICALAWLILTSGCPWLAIVGICVAIIDIKHFLFWIEVGLLYNLFIDLIKIVVMNG